MKPENRLSMVRGCRDALPAGRSPNRRVSGPVRGLIAVVLLGTVLGSSGFVRADDHLQAALAVVVPPDDADIERIIEAVSVRDGATDVAALRQRLRTLYRSEEFRIRTARIYARHLSEAELTYLAETLDHPVFRKYRQLAPRLMVELAELEREMLTGRPRPEASPRPGVRRREFPDTAAR